LYKIWFGVILFYKTFGYNSDREVILIQSI